MSEQMASEVRPVTIGDRTLTRLFDELPDVVIVLDGGGQVLWGNSRAERLFGHSLEEYAGQSALSSSTPTTLSSSSVHW